MNRAFLKPSLARYFQKHVASNAKLLDSKFSKIRAMREKYVTKLNVIRGNDTEIVLGLGNLEDLDVLTGKRNEVSYNDLENLLRIGGKKKSEVSYNELVDLLRIGGITLVDVRDPNELQATGRMPQSINIPLNQLKNVLTSKDQGNPNETLTDEDAIVFCGLGNVKSITALEIAHKLGLKNARHYPGGYQEWVNEAAKLITEEQNEDQNVLN